MGNCISFNIEIPFDVLFSCCQGYAAKRATYKRDLKDNLATLKTELEKLIAARDDVMRRVNLAEQQQQLKRLAIVDEWLRRVETVKTEVDQLIDDGPKEIDKFCLGGCCSNNCRCPNYKFGRIVARKLQDVATLLRETGNLQDQVAAEDLELRKATYIGELEANLGTLKTELKKLIAARVDVTTRVDIAEEQPHVKRLAIVEEWLTRVQATETEVADLLETSSQEIQNRNPNYMLGRNVTEKLQVVATLKEEAGKFQELVVRMPNLCGDERPCEPTVGMQSTFNKVWSRLVHERMGIIGLQGMGGVGKTTLLNHINNKLCETPNHSAVIWVTVSKDLQLEKVQERIGQKIGLSDESWKSKSLEDKALDIFRILSKKEFVLLLDDIWERIDLTKLGVPHPSQKVTSNIIFTTRLISVCSSMEAHMIKVECLAYEDAWRLFKSKVGEATLDSHPEILELAKAVAKECDGLPLALIIVGRAMTYKKAPQQWRHAIKLLRGQAYKFQGMDKVYLLLKFSYDNLPANTIRRCLLYCSLFSEDYRISKRDLISYWICEGFLDDKTGAQNEGYDMIGDLVHACLLEEKDNVYVKMHDVVRDMALWIANDVEKEKEHSFVRAGVGLTEAPEVREWEGVKRMSVMENKILNLSVTPNCPRLLTLFLNNNRLKMINSGFFRYMSSLHVLNLSNNPYLSKLPSEISTLVSLQHLDLSCTDIEVLPGELAALVKLKCLNLEHMSRLHTIPKKLISNFPMLCVLRLLGCGYVESKVLWNDEEVLMEELLCLKHLTTLSITIISLRSLDRFMSSPKLQSCTQSLALEIERSVKVSLPTVKSSRQSLTIEVKKSNNYWLAVMEHLDTLEIRNCYYMEELKIDYTNEVKRTRFRYGFHNLNLVNIIGCLYLRHLSWLILAPNVKHIEISYSDKMEEVISVEKLGEFPDTIRDQIPFSKLEILRLYHLQNLQSIYWNALPFQHLKEIRVFKCPKLKKLPVDSNSAKESKIVIEGQKRWWDDLQWEDEATQNAFRPCFRSW